MRSRSKKSDTILLTTTAIEHQIIRFVSIMILLLQIRAKIEDLWSESEPKLLNNRTYMYCGNQFL